MSLPRPTNTEIINWDAIENFRKKADAEKVHLVLAECIAFEKDIAKHEKTIHPFRLKAILKEIKAHSDSCTVEVQLYENPNNRKGVETWLNNEETKEALQGFETQGLVHHISTDSVEDKWRLDQARAGLWKETQEIYENYRKGPDREKDILSFIAEDAKQYLGDKTYSEANQEQIDTVANHNMVEAVDFLIRAIKQGENTRKCTVILHTGRLGGIIKDAIDNIGLMGFDPTSLKDLTVHAKRKVLIPQNEKKSTVNAQGDQTAFFLAVMSKVPEDPNVLAVFRQLPMEFGLAMKGYCGDPNKKPRNDTGLMAALVAQQKREGLLQTSNTTQMDIVDMGLDYNGSTSPIANRETKVGGEKMRNHKQR